MPPFPISAVSHGCFPGCAALNRPDLPFRAQIRVECCATGFPVGTHDARRPSWGRRSTSREHHPGRRRPAGCGGDNRPGGEHRLRLLRPAFIRWFLDRRSRHGHAFAITRDRNGWVEMYTSDSPGLEEPTIKSKNKAPAFQRPETPPQVVPYGTVVYHGDYTCASELAGMTCWNTITGHGAFMSSTNTTAFQEACSQTTLRPVKSVVKPYAILDGGCEQAPGCDVQVRRSGWCDESVLGVDRERPPSRSGAELSKEPAPRREIFRWPTLPMPTLCPHPELARLIVDDN